MHRIEQAAQGKMNYEDERFARGTISGAAKPARVQLLLVAIPNMLGHGDRLLGPLSTMLKRRIRSGNFRLDIYDVFHVFHGCSNFPTSPLAWRL